MTQTPNNPQAILDQLQQLLSPSLPKNTIDIAKGWHHTIDNTKKFLENQEHPIVFIGSVGVGKSSLIGIVANLIVGHTPKDRTSLKNNSVLAIGSGRTTVCEVRICSYKPENDKGKLGLIIEPFTQEDMEKEIQIYAEDEWQRRQLGSSRLGEDDRDLSSLEVQRTICGMTNYVEYQETYMEGENRKRRKVRPLDTVIPTFDSANAFATHMIERANLPKRTKTEWWWNEASVENLRELKICFEALNSGTEQTAMLPQTMTLVAPESLPDSNTGLNLTLIDTRGLDGAIESREDIQKFLRDPRALLVLCATFKDAPSDPIRNLLLTVRLFF